MTKAVFALLIFAIFASCENNDEKHTPTDPITTLPITKNPYLGVFDYKGQKYWCKIAFDSNRYEEWPSGGAWFQKELSCLTVGTCSTKNDTLSFVLGSLKFKDFLPPCNPDMFLPGNYKIISTSDKDSLIFKKGVGDSQIIYYLKKYVGSK